MLIYLGNLNNNFLKCFIRNWVLHPAGRALGSGLTVDCIQGCLFKAQPDFSIQSTTKNTDNRAFP